MTEDAGHATVREVEDPIAWVLAHPGMSAWLKATLTSALKEDSLALANDLEILNHLLGPRVGAVSRPHQPDATRQTDEV
ncbi:MAG: hypothetical protein K2X07_12430 [Caulobacteraceae bacterium]|nr:hypothetical protein [Caulobacteraceae bacterium]